MYNLAVLFEQKFDILKETKPINPKAFIVSFVFMALFGLFTATQAGEKGAVLSTDELKQLSGKIKAAEESVDNVKIEAESWVETKVSLSDPCWQPTPIYCSYKGLFSRTTGNAIVDVNKEVVKWEKGLADFAEKSYSLSFDGNQGRYLLHSHGPLGQSRPVKNGQILPEKPPGLKGNFLYWSLPFFNGEIYKFSEIFRRASDPNSEVASELEFIREEFEGAECIRIRDRLYDVYYWLDESHGFAIRGKKSIAKYKDGHEEIIRFVRVTQLKEVSPGIWWPTEIITVARPYESGEPYRRYIYRTSNVVVNDPNLVESVFKAPIPKGYLINDRIKGIEYRSE